jgi:hypothetical protein
MLSTKASGLTTGCFLYIVGHENCGQIPDLALLQSSRMRKWRAKAFDVGCVYECDAG